MQQSIVIPTQPETTTDVSRTAKRVWVSPHFEAIELKSAENTTNYCSYNDGLIFSGC